MIDLDADIAVLGAGFGGSVMALVLDRIGLRPVLIDRGTHPRFAIGESSTPIANLVLRDLARDYDLPRLAPLAKYGSWQAAYPHVVCGLKRGFSYFQHVPCETFSPRADHGNELLVAASPDDLHGDTHWLRSDVDGFLAAEAQAAGIPHLDRTEITEFAHSPPRIRGGVGWLLTGHREAEPVRIAARFLIDATGEGGALPRALGISREPVGMHTHSRALFAHFRGLKPWHEFLQVKGGQVQDHPFCCDHAALHQLLEEGWMWQLRFNNGVTSAGFALDPRRLPLDPHLTPEEEWRQLMDRYPSIADQFAGTELVDPPGSLKRSGRLQRRAARVVGEGWALLLHTAGFIDPLHSTGIAQTLCGIERLARILARCWNRDELVDELRGYEQIVHTELDFVDEIVAGGYATLGRFNLFATYAMLYFAAVTTYENRRLNGTLSPIRGFLCADDPALRQVVRQVTDLVNNLLKEPGRNRPGTEFEAHVAQLIAPYNTAGLCDPAARNMYHRTALPG